VKILTPQEMRAELKVSVHAAVDANVELVTRLLRESKEAMRAEVRAAPTVVGCVAEKMRAAGWHCLVEKGGARDAGATWGLTVSATPFRCPTCNGRGVWVDERGGDTGRCSGCGGKGTLS